MGHVHHDLSIPEIQEMYRQVVGRLLDEVTETEKFFRAELSPSISQKPFTGNRSGHEDEIIGTKVFYFAFACMLYSI